MNLYLIGPVTGRACRNAAEFQAARKRLEACGHVVTIPHDIIDKDALWPEAMRKSINYLTSGLVDGVAHLDCEPSTGSSIEYKIAEICKMPVMPVSGWAG